MGNPQNRVYDSTGPDGKVRGTPQQIVEKYRVLSRDAATVGDHVAAESYLQHAEHYSRMVISARKMQQQRRDEHEDHVPDENSSDEMRANGAEFSEEDADAGGNSRPPPRRGRAAPDSDGGPSSSRRRPRRYMGSGEAGPED